MTRATHTIIPQRHGERGWQLCGPHQAQAWTIISIREGKIVARFASKTTAKARLAQLVSNKAPKLPCINGRMIQPRPDAPVARSLTRAEYDALILGGK